VVATIVGTFLKIKAWLLSDELVLYRGSPAGLWVELDEGEEDTVADHFVHQYVETQEGDVTFVCTESDVWRVETVLWGLGYLTKKVSREEAVAEYTK
jgi:hypothetical protein